MEDHRNMQAIIKMLRNRLKQLETQLKQRSLPR